MSDLTTKRLANTLTTTCDAIYELITEDEYSGAIRRLEEAAVGLGGEGAVEDTGDRDAVAAALRAVKHLSSAMEALAADAVSRAEMETASAASALRSAVRILRSSIEDGGGESPVQMSVAEALRVPTEEALHDALENLLNRTESGAFVIFVDAHTGNFIQFFGSKEEPLVLDLSTAKLSDAEMERAVELFAAEGIDYAGGDDGRPHAGEEESFSVNLGRDPDRATELALRIFSGVYGSTSDFTLKIEEN